MNGIRQETASCIAFYGVKYIINRQPWKYFFVIMIAFGFHTSALLLLPLYPLVVSGRNYTPNKWIQWILMLIPALLAIRRYDIFSRFFPILDQLQQIEAFSSYDQYNGDVLQKYSDITQIGILFYIFLGVNSIIIFTSKKLQLYFTDKNFRIYYNLYFWGMLCEMAVAQNMVLARPFRYFRIYKLTIIAYTLYYLVKHPSYTNIIVFILLIALMFAGLGLISIQSPFQFFFEVSYAP